MCELFSREYNVVFNADKTPCIRYGKSPYIRNTHDRIKLDGRQLKWYDKITYLGSILRYDLSDVTDIEHKIGIFISQVNNVNRRFEQLSACVKRVLMQTYCCSWFGCQTWEIKSSCATKMNTTWNKAVRRVLYIPYRTHRALLPYLSNNDTFYKQHCARFIKFYNSMVTSKNASVKFIAEYVQTSVVSATGRNRVHCQLLYGNIAINIMLLHNVEHIESEELDRQAVQIMQLIGVREGTVVLPGFTADDVDQLLEVLCCDQLLVTVGHVW